MKLNITCTAFILSLISVCLSQRSTSSSSLSSSSRNSSKKECTAQDIAGCTKFLLSMSEGSDVALPSTREDLKRICDDLRIGVKCLDRHMRICFTQEQTLVYGDLVNPAKEFIHQLCDDIRTQADFLKHASCYRNISLDAGKCAVKYQEAIQTSSSATDSKNPETSIKMSCCALDDFVKCKYEHVARDCGKEAEVFMRNHLSPMTNPIMDKHCAAYTTSCGQEPQKKAQVINGSQVKTCYWVSILSVILTNCLFIVSGDKFFTE